MCLSFRLSFSVFFQDVNRTYRDHIMFRERYNGRQRALFHVLAAYSMYNTEVGYCQGMSQVRTLSHLSPVWTPLNGSFNIGEVCKRNRRRQWHATVLALATSGGATEIVSFLFASHRPRWSTQVQWWLACRCCWDFHANFYNKISSFI